MVKNGNRYYTLNTDVALNQDAIVEFEDETPNESQSTLVQKRSVYVEGEFEHDTFCCSDNKLYALRRVGLLQDQTCSIEAYDLATGDPNFKLIYEVDVTKNMVLFTRYMRVCGDLLVLMNGALSVYVHDRKTGKELGMFKVDSFTTKSFIYMNCLIVPLKNLCVYNVITRDKIRDWKLGTNKPIVLPYNGFLYAVFHNNENTSSVVVNTSSVTIERFNILTEERVSKTLQLFTSDGIHIFRAGETISHAEIYKGNLFLVISGQFKGFFAIPLNTFTQLKETSLTTDIRLNHNERMFHFWKDAMYTLMDRRVYRYPIPEHLTLEKWKSETVIRTEGLLPLPYSVMEVQNGSVFLLNSLDGGDWARYRIKLPNQNETVLVPRYIDDATFDEAKTAFLETMTKTPTVFENKFFQRLVTKFRRNDGYYNRMLSLANLISDDRERALVLDQVRDIHRLHIETQNVAVLESRMNNQDGIEASLGNHYIEAPHPGRPDSVSQVHVGSQNILNRVAQYM